MHACIYMCMFRPSQDSSVLLGLANREQLISPECSKHQVLYIFSVFSEINLNVNLNNFVVSRNE